MPTLLKSWNTSCALLPPPPSAPHVIAPSASVSNTEVPLQLGKLVRNAFANIPPVYVLVPEPVSVIVHAPLIFPAATNFPASSMFESVVVAFPTQSPPDTNKSDVAPLLPMTTSPGFKKRLDGEEEPKLDTPF